MLEFYVENFDGNEFVKSYMAKNRVTRTEAIREIRHKIPKESYYQDKIKKAIKKRYPDGFIRKISQGPYAEGGTPDVMAIIEGHYFGFEVKRPLVGVPSDLQIQTIRQIRAAGGTAEIVTWPEEAIRIIEGFRGKTG